jgi:hypothetical protein
MEHLLHLQIALASNVLPVPGGPTNKTPLSLLQLKYIFPALLKRNNLFKFCFASSIPAISSNVIPVSGRWSNRAGEPSLVMTQSSVKMPILEKNTKPAIKLMVSALLI